MVKPHRVGPKLVRFDVRELDALVRGTSQDEERAKEAAT
jgi:hypothetical protein